jgi:tetratricopeptide (TPR) repeat protein
MALGVAKLEKAYRRSPQAPLFAHLAEIYLKKGDVPRALTLCLSGCKLFPDYPTGHLILSRCYEVQGDLEDARKALVRGLLLDPVNPSGCGRLARICHQLGDLPMALKSMQKAANLDAFSETAQQEVQSLEQELHEESGKTAETDEGETVAALAALGPEADQDVFSGSAGEAAKMEAASSVEENASQVSEPEGDEPFRRIYEEPDPKSTSSQTDDPAKLMKSADEIQDDIDAFFDTMSVSPAALPAIDEPDADSLLASDHRDPVSSEGVEEMPTAEAAELEPVPDLVSLSAAPTEDLPSDALDSAGAEALATLMTPTVAADDGTAETDPNASADSPADPAPPASDNQANVHLVLSAPSEMNVPAPLPDAESGLDAGEPVEPSPTEERDPMVDSFISLTDAPSSEPSTMNTESEPVDAPADPMLFLDSNSTRPPESRVADLDGTAPTPTSPPDESDDLGLDGEESDHGEIANLAPVEDQELAQLFQEIDEHGSEQSEMSVEKDPGETAPKDASIATATLAALYQQQGLVEQAVEIYRRLLEEEPENAEFRRKIEELNG